MSAGNQTSRGFGPRWASTYAVVLTICTVLLICSGGMVTSKNAGLAVPDWPNSYGYNMFTFPVSRWVGGVFFEHTHRLAASVVGLLTIGLAVILATAEQRRWVKNLGYTAVALVVTQGVLGGLRVVLVADWIGVFHGCVAQAFLALVALIALVASRWWQQLPRMASEHGSRLRSLDGLNKKLLVIAVLIYGQLALGAAMRHAHSGLSIHDFPKAYGHWWPQVHKADLPAINWQRTEIRHEPATTLAQIHLQMTHRINAALISSCIVVAVGSAWRRRATLPASLVWLTTGGLALVVVQITLGMYTIWSNKAADIATAHVATGATLLVWSVVSYAAMRRYSTGAVSTKVPVQERIPVLQTVEARA